MQKLPLLGIPVSAHVYVCRDICVVVGGIFGVSVAALLYGVGELWTVVFG